MTPVVDTRLTCARCGYEGYDVTSKIVEVDPSVLVAVGDYEVPERFRAESRCLDRTACDERADAPRLVTPPDLGDVEMRAGRSPDTTPRGAA